MKNLAVILARSGSKGLIDKNIKLINGKPLMAHSIDSALKSGIFDKVVVSTDSQMYAEIAIKYGAEAPYLRTAQNASDTASSWDAVREVIKCFENDGVEFETVALLQPTSPLRDEKDIIGAYELYVEKSAKSVVSVCEAEHSPLLCNTLDESLSLNGFIDMSKSGGPRQLQKTYYRLNGAIYFVDAEHILNSNDIYGKDSYAYIMSKEKSIDIDTELDFRIAEYLMMKA